MKRIKRYILPVAAIVILACVFFLPDAVAGVMDAGLLDNYATMDARSVSIETRHVLSLSDRIALVASPTTEIMALATGRVMEREEAEARMLQELERLFEGYLFVFKAEGCTVMDGSAAFAINTDDPMINAIVWSFMVADGESNEVTVTIDDESGFILKIIYQQGSGAAGTEAAGDGGRATLSFEDMNEAALKLTARLTEYYGTTVRLGDFVLAADIAYYRADVYSLGPAVAMYGVIRPTGFTMNERV